VLNVVLRDRAFIECELTHLQPLLLISHGVDLTDDPDQQGIARNMRQADMKIPVRSREGDGVGDAGFHLGEKLFHLFQILHSGMQDCEAADMRLQRETRIDQFERPRVLDHRIGFLLRLECHICPASGPYLDQPLLCQTIEGFAHRSAGDPEGFSHCPLRRQSILRRADSTLNLTPQQGGNFG